MSPQTPNWQLFEKVAHIFNVEAVGREKSPRGRGGQTLPYDLIVQVNDRTLCIPEYAIAQTSAVWKPGQCGTLIVHRDWFESTQAYRLLGRGNVPDVDACSYNKLKLPPSTYVEDGVKARQEDTLRSLQEKSGGDVVVLPGPPGVKAFELTEKGRAHAAIVAVCKELRDLLLEKNEKYGNSALNPVRIFSKADSVEQLRVRLDDKISRIQTTGESADDEDTLFDLLGYGVLLVVAKRRVAT